MTATVLPAAGTCGLPWVDRLADYGERVALHTSAGPVSYRELAADVDDLARRLAGARRLVQVEATTSASSVVALLAAQAAGHVVLLGAPGTAAATLRAHYDPDVVLDAAGSVDVRRPRPAVALHPELALLLSTSGSTGATKLVRLSAGNLVANAAQITEALDVRADDCAALTLPLSYCYGLSVLTTHLAAGASVMLPAGSVVDEGFWRDARDAGVTTIPGVPHTFELLERSGFAQRHLPTLRRLTQAGGRMDPDRVRRFAALGRRRGVDLVVMYGQCEATARMTTLPPHLALERPDTVGVPVPGASVELDDGEIVFRGPNVMLGYAHGPADLALGRTTHALRTGDLGELTEDGLLRVVGRRARFVKVLGHRVDLDALEARLRGDGTDARCAGRDGLVVVAVRDRPVAACEAVRRDVVRCCGVPRDCVRVVAVEDQPLLPNGKPDPAALLGLATQTLRPGAAEPPPGSDVATVFADVLGVQVGPDDTFAGLGGDSLSYVEASIRLEDALGRLPDDWHVTPVAALEAGREVAGDPAVATPARQRWREWPQLESSIWLRALAIVLIVGTHAHLFTLQGTANALLVLAGYQLARFQLVDPDRRRRTRRILRSVGRVVAPTLAVVVVAHVVLGRYEPRNLVLLNWVFGEARLGPPWRFWFVEALVLALLVVAALTRSRTVATLDRRYPLGLPLALTALAFVLFRVPWLPLPVPRMQGSALVVLHLVLLGWALARARTPSQRLLCTAVVLAVVMTFSGNHARDGLTAAVVLTLLWVPVTRVPAVLVPVARVLASASLFVYVVHWQALELLWGHPALAFAGSLALGVGYWWLWTRPITALGRRVVALVRARSRQAGTVDSSTSSPESGPSANSSGRPDRASRSSRSRGQTSSSVAASSAGSHQRMSATVSRSSSV